MLSASKTRADLYEETRDGIQSVADCQKRILMFLYAVPIKGRDGAINAQGELVIPARFETIYRFSENRATFEEEGKYGVIDSCGQVICPPEYNEISLFNEGFAAVKKKGQFGFINNAGQLVVPCRFFNVGHFSEGLAYAQETIVSKYGFIDSNGVFQIRPQFVSVFYDFHEGLTSVLTETATGELGDWGYIDQAGNFAIEPKFGMAFRFSEGVAAVSKSRKVARCGFIDHTGVYKIKPGFNGSDIHFSEGLASVWNQKGFGFIDHEGNLKIPFQYYFADHFRRGLSRVQIREGDKYGYINRDGEFVIPPTFDTADSFNRELASVGVGETDWGYINTKGDFVWKSGEF